MSSKYGDDEHDEEPNILAPGKKCVPHFVVLVTKLVDVHHFIVKLMGAFCIDGKEFLDVRGVRSVLHAERCFGGVW